MQITGHMSFLTISTRGIESVNPKEHINNRGNK